MRVEEGNLIKIVYSISPHLSVAWEFQCYAVS